jgi:hypothetical protein
MDGMTGFRRQRRRVLQDAESDDDGMLAGL